MGGYHHDSDQTKDFFYLSYKKRCNCRHNQERIEDAGNRIMDANKEYGKQQRARHSKEAQQIDRCRR